MYMEWMGLVLCWFGFAPVVRGLDDIIGCKIDKGLG
jgi:hypothetical protein